MENLIWYLVAAYVALAVVINLVMCLTAAHDIKKHPEKEERARDAGIGAITIAVFRPFILFWLFYEKVLEDVIYEIWSEFQRWKLKRQLRKRYGD